MEVNQLRPNNQGVSEVFILKDDLKRLVDYVRKIESKRGTVMLMNKRESSHMYKLSKLCYRNEDASLNRYEITVIKKHLSGEINDCQLAYYLGGVTKSQALKMATLYNKGRYTLTNHKNYWEK